MSAKLAEQGFAADVSGRAKHLYSIYRKMQSQQCDFDQVYDVIAFRANVESVSDCYAALGVIHSQWTPVPGRFKDYVALPKPNMYQSLHTTVIGPGRERIEIQIRTHDMHRVAEQGIAAHWKYKENNSGGVDPKDAARFGWLRQLMDLQKELKDPAEFLETVKVDLFQDEVYVFTPKGDVRVFPRGSTPVDFAYAIHSEIGEHCAGARVNGAIAPLRYKLRNGDVVEVMTAPGQHPSKDWLDFVVTSRARSKIRAFLRTEQRERSLKLGKELLEKELHGRGMSLTRLQKQTEEMKKVTHHFSVSTAEELFIAVGYGKVQPKAVTEFLAPPKEGDTATTEPPSSIKCEGASSRSCAASRGATRRASGFAASTTSSSATRNAVTRSRATRSSASSREAAASRCTGGAARRPSTPTRSAASRSRGTRARRSPGPSRSA